MEEALEIEMPGENQTFPVEDVLQHFSCEECSKEAWYGTSQLDTRCVACNMLDEDGGHLFCKCKYVKHLWQELNLEHVKLQLDERTSAKDMLQMIWELEEMECILMVTLADVALVVGKEPN